ncbi:conserved hypothetical protein [Verrucomicrobia bacterium]|nr:conserved hypothetical protein [Verrucomicrobiota bacterium]
MFRSLADRFREVKDGAVEMVAKTFLNREIERFGAVMKLEIDSKAKTMWAELALKGETGPIAVKIGRYELVQENGVTAISFQGATCSREWISVVLNEYLADRKFQVPDAVKKLL